MVFQAKCQAKNFLLNWAPDVGAAPQEGRGGRQGARRGGARQGQGVGSRRHNLNVGRTRLRVRLEDEKREWHFENN